MERSASQHTGAGWGRVITLVKGGRKVSHLFNKQVSLMPLRTLDCYLAQILQVFEAVSFLLA